jgi:hypothetical protein
MTKNSRTSLSELATQQGATALLTATCAFLRRNNISKKLVMDSVRLHYDSARPIGRVRQYRKLVRAYEDMGMIMSTWFSLSKFLDHESLPLPLTGSRGQHSIANLIRSSRVKISVRLAVQLLRRSPSVRIDTRGNFVALERVFVLPDFEIPRAALVIERYLDTLRSNSSAHRNGTTLLLERNCHVREIDVRRISPILRDIKGRGTAFMDSVDGDIEAHRTRKSKRKGVGDLGVLVFAWTRASKIRRSKSKSGTHF